MADIEYSPATIEQPDWNPQERLRHHSGAFEPVWVSPQITATINSLTTAERGPLHPAIEGKYFDTISVLILNKTNRTLVLKVRLGEDLDNDGNIATGSDDLYIDCDIVDPSASLTAWYPIVLFKATNKEVVGGQRSFIVGPGAMAPARLPRYFQIIATPSGGDITDQEVKLVIYGKYSQ